MVNKSCAYIAQTIPTVHYEKAAAKFHQSKASPGGFQGIHGTHQQKEAFENITKQAGEMVQQLKALAKADNLYLIQGDSHDVI